MLFGLLIVSRCHEIGGSVYEYYLCVLALLSDIVTI